MRPLPRKQIKVRNVTIGGEKPLICLPLAEKRQRSLRDAAKRLLSFSPDMVEWRVDGFEGVADITTCQDALFELRHLLTDIPLLFTCRSSQEGGSSWAKDLSETYRLALLREVITSGAVDLVDIELRSDASTLESVLKIAQKQGVKVVLSYHNFTGTPQEKELIRLLLQAENRGADIAKIAVMAHSSLDVLALFSATSTARAEKLSIPMIAIAMGEMGKISRLAGGLWGADITFAAWDNNVSAPGQLPAEKMRQAMGLFY